MVGANPQLDVPALALGEPVLEPSRRVVRGDEELHLHLLKLTCPENEIAGRDLVAERLADLRDPERRLSAGELQDVLEVDEDALGGLRAQVDGRALLLHRPDGRLEHQIEVARLGQVAVGALAGVLRGLLTALELVEVIGAEALLAGAAVDERIGEAGEVAGGLPHPRVLDDRAVERDDVVAVLQHRAPPLALDVRLEQDAVMAVVIGRSDPTVDLGGGEDEAAPLAQRDDLLHGHNVAHRWRTLSFLRTCRSTSTAARRATPSM